MSKPRLRAGIKKIADCHDKNKVVQEKAVPRDPVNKVAGKKAALFPEFRALARAFNSMQAAFSVFVSGT